MKLNVQKRIAASIGKCSPKRVKFDTSRLEDIKESITKADIKSLIDEKAIKLAQKKGVSRARARKRSAQKNKGRRKGKGKRKGTKKTRTQEKNTWMNKIRLQRMLIKKLRDKEIITKKTYQQLYMKAKGGFFRSIRHIKLYINEHNLAKEKIKE